MKDSNFAAASSPNLSPIHVSVASTALYPQSIKFTNPARITPPASRSHSAIDPKVFKRGINFGNQSTSLKANHPKRTVPKNFFILPHQLFILPGTANFIPFSLLSGDSTPCSDLALFSCSFTFLLSSAAFFSAARVPFRISSIFITFSLITSVGFSGDAFSIEEPLPLTGTILVLGRTASAPPFLFPKNLFLSNTAIMD